MSKKETSLNTPDPAGIATPLPDFLVGTAGVGNEAVTAQDVTFPRIGIIQALSPEIQKDHAKFIPGAQTGDLFDTLTRKIVPQPMRLRALDRIKPGAAEVAANPRARSAVMRVAERTEV